VYLYEPQSWRGDDVRVRINRHKGYACAARTNAMVAPNAPILPLRGFGVGFGSGVGFEEITGRVWRATARWLSRTEGELGSPEGLVDSVTRIMREEKFKWTRF
jgi:hypothetical protein